MTEVAVGFRVHSGWSAMVSVVLEKGVPRVLYRQRVHLVDTFTYPFRQPYHTAEKMPLAEGRQFIVRTETKARKLAFQAIRRLQAELYKLGYELNRSVLLQASGRPLPELEKILSSHALIHTADGELFRQSVIYASKRCRVALTCIKDRELLERATQALRLPRAKILTRALQLGRPFGAPWSQDEKFAAVAAWVALGGSKRARSKGIVR